VTYKPPAHDRDALFVVDRREAGVVILVDDSGKIVEVEGENLPAGCRAEGAALRVPLDAASQPIWQNAIRDKIEEKRRLQLNAERLDKLRRRDPGGDVSL
jgi:hypothetical protein